MAEPLGEARQTTFATPQTLAQEILRRKTGQRMLVALVGAPGSGKSTLSEALRSALVSEHNLSAEIVPMDGFHYDNAILDTHGWRPRKGAPHTFDVAGLASILERLRKAPAGDVAVPVFDRERDLSVASARIVGHEVEILLVEGNYLLLEQSPWDTLRQYFDLTIKIDCHIDVLEQRLLARWTDLGLSLSDARKKVEGNDLLNANLVANQSGWSDLLYRSN